MKRIHSILLALLLILGIIPGGAFGAAADAFDGDAYIEELSDLVQGTWSDSFLTEIEFRLNDTTMTVNGDVMEIDPENDVAPFLSDAGDTMLPLRVLSETLELDVEFDNDTAEINISGDGIEINLTRGERTMRVNGRRVALSTAPIIRNGRTYVPARAVTESLLFDVDYIPEGKRVVLTKPYQTRRLIVQTNGAAPDAALELDGLSATLKGPDNTFIMQFDTELGAKEALEKLDAVSVFAEPDVIVSIDTSAYRSWGVVHIGADKYQGHLASANVSPLTVAVLDTGIEASHPFLADRLTNGWNFINNNNDPRDGNGHGTHVSGTIAEMTLGNVTIIPVKVLSDQGSGAISLVDAGIRYAADRGAAVINLSLGGMGTSQSSRNAVQYANSKNSVVVVSAGNENANAANYTPANIPEVITVAAIDSRNNRAYFSNYGNVIDVAAPGVGINSSIPGGRYASYDGTSMAAPHVSGAVALLRSDPRYAELSPSAIKTALHELTDDAGTPGFDIYFGHGIVNIAKAISSEPPASPGDDPPFIPVTDITGVPLATYAGTPLVLTGNVQPYNATNRTVVWSVRNAGGTGATINGSTLNTRSAGTVIVRATVANGVAANSAYTKDFTIIVTAQPPPSTPPPSTPPPSTPQPPVIGSYMLTVTVVNGGQVTVTSTSGSSSSSSSSSGSGNSISTTSIGCPAGAQITITAVPNSGYRFRGWEVISGEISISNQTNGILNFVMPSSNVEIRLVFE